MLSILKNQEIIAINQDSIYGTSISPFRWGINVRYCLLGIFHHTYRWLNSLTGPTMQHTLLNTGAVPVRTEQFSCSYVFSEPRYHDDFSINTLQINTLSEPANMFFNLTESPWIRAGIQYSVRVGSPASRITL
jgi:alpha-galactosidase